MKPVRLKLATTQPRDKLSTTELLQKKSYNCTLKKKCLSKPVTLLVKPQSLPVPVKAENLKENHKMLRKIK